MSRFFKKSVALVLLSLLLSGFFVFNFAYADDTTNTNTTTGGQAATTPQWWDGLAKSVADVGASIGQFTANSAGGVVSAVLEFVMIPIASFFLALSGKILDLSVQFSVYGQGFTPGITTAINSMWVLVRDTANVFFIFILLYFAIEQIVLGKFNKEVLIWVVVAAVFINFSLFISKVIIDASNLVATSVYNQITVTTNSSNSGAKSFLNSAVSTNIDLSGRIMDALQLVTVYDTPQQTDTKQSTATMTGVGALVSTFVRLLLFFITTFVFMALAAMLIGRFVMLVILMATSPIGFIGKAIPIPGIGLGSLANDWWRLLMDQCLVAPALMFFMLLTIKLGQITTVQSNAIGDIGVYFNYFLIIYLLLKSIEITKHLSGPVGGMVEKVATTASGLAVGAATGGTAFALRQTVGRSANALANSQAGKRLEALGAQGGIIGGAAKLTTAGIKGTARSTFDVRSTGVAKETFKQVGELSEGKVNLAGGYAKAGGSYGKAGTGFAGSLAKKTEDANKEAATLVKSANDYQQQIVDRNIVEPLRKREIDLEAQIEKETDSGKKAQLEIMRKSVSDQRIAAQNNSNGAIDKLGSADTDFAAVQTRIDEIQKKQNDVSIKIANNQFSSSQEFIDAIKQRDDLAKQYETAEEDLNTAKVFVGANKALGTETTKGSQIEALKQIKGAKNDLAKSIRKRIVSLNTTSENAGIARTIEKKPAEKVVSNEDIQKQNEKILEKLEDQGKK